MRGSMGIRGGGAYAGIIGIGLGSNAGFTGPASGAWTGGGRCHTLVGAGGIGGGWFNPGGGRIARAAGGGAAGSTTLAGSGTAAGKGAGAACTTTTGV